MALNRPYAERTLSGSAWRAFYFIRLILEWDAREFLTELCRRSDKESLE